MRPTGQIEAAGAVVFRKGPEVLLVHRPRYDDWSFPKGKLDPGESAQAAAVREVEEETGLRVRLGRPLPVQCYEVRDLPKRVRYWIGRTAIGSDDVTGYTRGDEIDQVAWVPLDDARTRLTYSRDRDILQAAGEARKRTDPLIVLRHAEARPRSGWTGDDRRRPLLPAGRRQAVALAEVLAAYRIERVITSSSDRCVQTVAPYAAAAELIAERTDELAEEGASPAGVATLVARARTHLADRGGIALCTHRPVLPWLFAGLGVEDPGLAKGELIVLHLRHGVVTATERLAV